MDMLWYVWVEYGAWESRIGKGCCVEKQVQIVIFAEDGANVEDRKELSAKATRRSAKMAK